MKSGHETGSRASPTYRKPRRAHGGRRGTPASALVVPEAVEPPRVEPFDGGQRVGADEGPLAEPCVSPAFDAGDADRGAISDGIEAVPEARRLRESEQAIGAAGVDLEAGAPPEGQSPPFLEEH